MTHKGFHRLQKEPGGDNIDLLFIENVGNLVCPSTFDLGEHERVVFVSVPEGPDKPSKYPKAFSTSQTFVITKTDLVPSEELEWELEAPSAWGVFRISSVSREGLNPLLESLYERTRAEMERPPEEDEGWWVPE